MYLASNLKVQKYVQKDGEALLMAVKRYTLLVQAEKDSEAKEYLNQCMKSGPVKEALATKESVQFVLNLYKVEGIMGHTTAFTSKWIRTHLQNTYGGVSGSSEIAKEANERNRSCAN